MNALERKALIAEVSELRQMIGQSQFHNFVGASSSMRAIYRIIDTVAASNASVFIAGGKRHRQGIGGSRHP